MLPNRSVTDVLGLYRRSCQRTLLLTHAVALVAAATRPQSI